MPEIYLKRPNQNTTKIVQETTKTMKGGTPERTASILRTNFNAIKEPTKKIKIDAPTKAPTKAPTASRRSVRKSKELRKLAHKEQLKKSRNEKRAKKKEKVRALKFERQVIRTGQKKRNIGTKINSAKISLYSKIAKRRELGEVHLQRLEGEISRAREQLIQSLAEKNAELAKAEQLSVAIDRPVRFGEHPLFLPHLPLAPKFPPPSDMSFISFIYVLVDPNDNTVRYVGKTKNPEDRKKNHCSYETGNEKLWSWKNSINFKFRLEVVAVVDYHNWEQVETDWIRYYRSIGKIYNIHDGGRYIPKKKRRRKYAPRVI